MRCIKFIFHRSVFQLFVSKIHYNRKDELKMEFGGKGWNVEWTRNWKWKQLCFWHSLSYFSVSLLIIIIATGEIFNFSKRFPLHLLPIFSLNVFFEWGKTFVESYANKIWLSSPSFLFGNETIKWKRKMSG